MDNWKKEYDKLILSGKIDEAIKLCKSRVDENTKIYKFFRGTNRNFNTVKSNTLWLSRGDLFNDPFDSSFFVNCRSKDLYTVEEREVATQEYFDQKDQDKLSLKMQHDSLITSFSEIPDSILMWSYYAKDHKGFCIEYCLKDLMEKFHVLPVVYSEEMVPITEYTKDNRIIGMLVKAKCWEHEREWRMIKLADDDTLASGEVIKDIPVPTAFYYGSRIWNNEQENYESKREITINCKEMKDKECKITVPLSYEDQAVSIEQIMDYTKGKMKLYGFDLSRNEFKLQRITLKH